MLDLKGKNILLTGGAGFLGQEIEKILWQENVNSVIIPRAKDQDLTIEENVKELFENNNIEIVIHCAAFHGGIHYNIANGANIYYKNILMNTFLFEYAKDYKIEKMVCINTVDVYPRQTSMPLKVENVWDGYPEITSAPYAFSKKMMIVQSEAYRTQYDFSSINLLMINMYGPNDEFRKERCHVIPSLIQKIDEAKQNNYNTIKVWGDGLQEREFLFITDAAKMVISSLKEYNSSIPLNIGTGKTYSIKKLATYLLKIMDAEVNIVWDKSKPSGYPIKKFDMSHTDINISYSSRTDLPEGLAKTVDWYYNNYKIKKRTNNEN